MSGIAAVAKQLDKSLFRTTLNVLALRIPAKSCQLFLKSFQSGSCVLARPKIRAIVDDIQQSTADGSSSETKAAAGSKGKPATKLLLLNENIKDISELPEELRKLVAEHGAEAVAYKLEMDYSHVTYEEALRRVLPPNMTIPTAFELAGHIAHLNLRDEQMPYRYIIGQVLLEKNPAVKTVVCKVGTIENQYRVFNMEVIAGESNLLTEVRQQGFRFKFDYSKVYWNSRLEAEHARLVRLFRPGDVICDMMCGVGPFAIPAAAKGCRVFANDLNPDSYKWLVENAKLNKVTSQIHPFNLDARDFVRRLAVQQLAGKVPWFTHVVMNLPATAIEFLDVFSGLYSASASSSGSTAASSDSLEFILPTIERKSAVSATAATAGKGAEAKKAATTAAQQQQQKGRQQGEGKRQKEKEEEEEDEEEQRREQLPQRAADDSEPDERLPWVHCYCFSSAEGDAMADIRRRVEAVLGISLRVCHIHNVRNVSPKKDMFCVTFRLPASLAFGLPSSSSAAAAAAAAAATPVAIPPVKRKSPDSLEEGDNQSSGGATTAAADVMLGQAAAAGEQQQEEDDKERVESAAKKLRI